VTEEPLTDDELRAVLDPGPRAPAGAVERFQVSRDGRLLTDVSAGSGVESGADTAFTLLCAGKPLVAAALLRLVHESADVGLTDPVGQYVPALDIEGKRDIRLLDLLTHRTGITREPIPKGWTDDRILAWIANSPVDEAGRTTPEYGMFTSWHLIGLVIERLTGRDRVSSIEDLVLDPLGLRIGFGRRELPGAGPAPTLDVRTDTPSPLTWISDPDVLAAAWTGLGMWGSITELTRFYGYLIEPESHGLPSGLAAALRGLTATVGTGLRSWGTDSDDWAYSTGMYTGSAWIGRGFGFRVAGLDAATGTLGFVDPANRIVVTYGTNLMRLSAPVMLRRRRLVQAAYRLCGIDAFPKAS